MKSFKDQIILLTGATGGLGRVMATEFLSLGARLILSDFNRDSLEKMKMDLSRKDILGIEQADLSSSEDTDRLVKQVCDTYGCPDVLVNNAGIAVIGKFLDTPREKWESLIEINLLAPMRLTYGFLPLMLKRRSGTIVNVSSVAGLVATPGLNAYSTSKFGIKAFGEALHREYEKDGIDVTNLYPFFTRTPILESEQFGLDTKKQVPDFLLSEPEDVVRDLISGMKNRELHIYPGMISRSLDFVSRIFPGFLNGISP
ncbi:MAG: SDR family NAD(P)-dependent oxidoreductase [Leptospiraceae bacterium]|nr:SDR family NAD(P)-dependent oxidoreductase [Leptospiraceae bacterium]